jgi:CRP-like cAMP-binding protein
VRLTVRVRHGDLADMVGASRSRVTEHLSEFAQKHLISLRDRRLVAVDTERLKGFLKESHRERLSGEFSD